MKKNQLFQLLILIFIAFSCGEDNETPKGLSLEKVSGFVQKGPVFERNVSNNL